jgi:hypothetical protein
MTAGEYPIVPSVILEIGDQSPYDAEDAKVAANGIHIVASETACADTDDQWRISSAHRHGAY